MKIPSDKKSFVIVQLINDYVMFDRIFLKLHQAGNAHDPAKNAERFEPEHNLKGWMAMFTIMGIEQNGDLQDDLKEIFHRMSVGYEPSYATAEKIYLEWLCAVNEHYTVKKMQTA